MMDQILGARSDFVVVVVVVVVVMILGTRKARWEERRVDERERKRGKEMCVDHCIYICQSVCLSILLFHHVRLGLVSKASTWIDISLWCVLLKSQKSRPIHLPIQIAQVGKAKGDGGYWATNRWWVWRRKEWRRCERSVCRSKYQVEELRHGVKRS